MGSGGGPAAIGFGRQGRVAEQGPGVGEASRGRPRAAAADGSGGGGDSIGLHWVEWDEMWGEEI